MLPTVEQMPDAFVCVPCRVWQCAGVSVGRWQCAHLSVVPLVWCMASYLCRDKEMERICFARIPASKLVSDVRRPMLREGWCAWYAARTVVITGLQHGGILAAPARGQVHQRAQGHADAGFHLVEVGSWQPTRGRG